MATPALLVDTNILRSYALLAKLRDKIQAGLVRVYIPTLVHAERIRQVADEKGHSFAIDVVRQFVNEYGFELLPLSIQHAEAIAEVWLNLKLQGYASTDWRAHRFDIVLCAIAQSSGYSLVTSDTGRHFKLVANRIEIDKLEAWLENL